MIIVQAGATTVPAVADTAVAGWAVIAIAVIGVMLVILMAGILLTAWKVRGLVVQMSDVVTRLEPGLHPVVERVRAVSENVEHITRSVRKDVDQVTASVEALSGRVQQASDRIEERIEEFNAVIEVAQSEAEGILIETAATVRGVRAGAEALASRQLPSAHTAADEVDDDETTSDPADHVADEDLPGEIEGEPTPPQEDPSPTVLEA